MDLINHESASSCDIYSSERQIVLLVETRIIFFYKICRYYLNLMLRLLHCRFHSWISWPTFHCLLWFMARFAQMPLTLKTKSADNTSTLNKHYVHHSVCSILWDLLDELIFVYFWSKHIVEQYLSHDRSKNLSFSPLLELCTVMRQCTPKCASHA